MAQFLWICLGGALGTGARYLVGLGAVKLLGTDFPYGTLTVNLVGSFLISLVMYLSLDAAVLSAPLRMFLTTGVMGGFTTYSSFNYETLKLFQGGALALCATNVLVTLVGCALAGMLGLFVAARLAG
ncbi:MAG: fluoride efflux transporter CrcB [Myxococcales bacterium]